MRYMVAVEDLAQLLEVYKELNKKRPLRWLVSLSLCLIRIQF